MLLPLYALRLMPVERACHATLCLMLAATLTRCLMMPCAYLLPSYFQENTRMMMRHIHADVYADAMLAAALMLIRQHAEEGFMMLRHADTSDTNTPDAAAFFTPLIRVYVAALFATRGFA